MESSAAKPQHLMCFGVWLFFDVTVHRFQWKHIARLQMDKRAIADCIVDDDIELW